MPADASAYLRDLLARYGLESLTDWMLDLIRQGGEQVDENVLIQQLRERPEYKTRFAAIEQRRQAGLPAISEADVLNYENTARQMFRAVGLPPGFYDQPEDFVDLLVKDVSPAELQGRIEDGWVRVAQQDPNVRAAFAEWFGPQSDAALAAVFLDPDKALPVLQKQVAAAEIGGLGRNFGFGDFTVDQALGVAAGNPGLSTSGVNQALGRLAAVRPVFSETASRRERGDDLVAGREGLAYAFDTGDAERVRTRIRQRLAEFGGGSRAASGQRGLVGLGSAGQ